MKRFLLTIVLANLVALLLAGDLVLLNVKAKDGIKHLTRLDNLTVNYLGNGFVIGTKSGDLMEEFTLIEHNAWQPGTNYFLVFVNKAKSQAYLQGVKSYSEIVYQSDDLAVIKVSDEKLKDFEPPVEGSLAYCIRVLLLWNTDKAQTEIRHSYLKEAATLRPDLKGVKE